MENIGDKLNQLADRVLEKVLNPISDASLEQQLDALKAITALHLGLLKARKGVPSDEGTGTSMHVMRARLKAVEGE